MTSAQFLIVDLDDTLVRTDTLVDLVIKTLRQKPFLIFSLPFVLIGQGRSGFKAFLAKTCPLDPTVLPYRQHIIELCRQHRQQDASHRVVLASAADQNMVNAVAKHLQIFDETIGSQPAVNVKGRSKLAAIQKLTQASKFIYIGDSKADLPIWAASSHAILVNPSRRVLSEVQSLGISTEVYNDRVPIWRLIVKQLRPHQWVKNGLVCVPVLAAHDVFDGPLWVDAFLAMATFSALASTVYVLNDMVDFEADRRHPSKRNRPFASGDLPLKVGFVMLPLLLATAGILASFLPQKFQMMGALYLALNLLYSFKLKEQIIIDVVFLAAFYTLRMLAGGYATAVPVSSWLLSFSTFFFFGLAMVKRYTELMRMPKGQNSAYARGYVADDALPVLVLGIGTSLLALLVMALYFSSPEVSVLYRHYQRLWLLIPTLLFWTARTWILAHRGQVDDDPVLFALRDRVSWISVLFFGLVILVSV